MNILGVDLFNKEDISGSLNKVDNIREAEKDIHTLKNAGKAILITTKFEPFYRNDNKMFPGGKSLLKRGKSFEKLNFRKNST